MDTTPQEQIVNLLHISGNKKADVPGTNLGREILILRLIYEAQQMGSTWADIGYALFGKRDGKLAKKAAKKLANQTQKQLLTQEVSDA